MQLGIIGAVLAVILAGGVFLFSGTSNESVEKEAMEKQAMMEKDAMMQKEQMDTDAMMKDEVMESEDVTMKKDGVMMKEDAMMKKEDTMVKDDSMMQTEEAMMEKGDAMMVKGSIQNYSPDKLALAEKGKVLLFFHANWCPICRGLDAEAAANPNIVPDGITVLKVDFDTATALRQKYGVTVQHTFVQVDATGNSLKKFSDASTYGAVFGKVQ